jgi:hypothetical protein
MRTSPRRRLSTTASTEVAPGDLTAPSSHADDAAPRMWRRAQTTRAASISGKKEQVPDARERGERQ